METETLLRVFAVVVAAVVLATNWDYSPMIDYFKSFFRKQDQSKNAETSFLEVVESWHKLRNQCESLKLEEAVAKIDEVFPLLNVED